MRAIDTEEERREFKRFRIKEDSSFVSNSTWPDKGILVDISKGGVAFHYHADSAWPDGFADEYMLFGDHDSCLNHLPMEVVADRIVHYGQSNTLLVRRRSLKFGPLNEQQKFLLECFIWINSTAQC